MENQYLEFIYSRRSTRQYTDEVPADELLENIFRAACRAPSSKALYPCHFVLLRERAAFERIMEFHDKSIALKTAPIAVVVCADTALSPLCWREDAAAATMNILYAAGAQGLGSCWHGVYPREHRVAPMKELLKLPEHIIPCSLVTIGYAKNKKAPQQRFDEGCLHLNGSW